MPAKRQAGRSEARAAGDRRRSRASVDFDTYRDDYQVGLREIIDAKIEDADRRAGRGAARSSSSPWTQRTAQEIPLFRSARKKETGAGTPVSRECRQRNASSAWIQKSDDEAHGYAVLGGPDDIGHAVLPLGHSVRTARTPSGRRLAVRPGSLYGNTRSIVASRSRS